MVPLTAFSLPLPPDGPPTGFSWEEREMSILSTTTAVNTAIDNRDIFLGIPRCVICGYRARQVLQHCHISRDSEPNIWIDLRNRHWIPSQTKALPRHEPRNGILMCGNHHGLFDSYRYFIRFVPAIGKFVCVNYSGDLEMRPYHGKAIALDIKDRHSPFPSLFILHEVRVRAFHPFQPVAPNVLDEVPWQDWILSSGVLDNVSDSYFKRDSPPDQGDKSSSAQPQVQFQPTTIGTGGASSGGGMALPLNADVVAEILAVTHAMPSWRACQMEGTSWTGTAEDNIKKYISTIGVQDPPPLNSSPSKVR